MKIVTILGARPQFIKAGPVSRALSGVHDEVIVHTGQHYDAAMSEIFFRELGLTPPTYHLGVGSGSHGRQTGRMLEAIETVLGDEQPDVVLVYGDTNSTLAGGLAAAKMHIPVAHVEAGLRSFNRQMPEELNRVLTDHLAALLFCPTESARDNLAAEGVTAGVFVVGDVMKDALEFWLPAVREPHEILREQGLHAQQFYLATVHRAENVDNPLRLRAILDALDALDSPVVLPVHPRTAAALERMHLPRTRGVLRLIPPLGYLDMIWMERHAKAILTDSGGVQKEAYLLGTPCVTLREETEWPETVTTGWNRLVGAVTEQIVKGTQHTSIPTSRPELFGDGQASERISRLLNDA